MLGGIATATGYVRAPKTTYVVRHPIRARQMARVRRGIQANFTPGRVALGLGILTAIPFGIWVGRRIAESRRQRQIEGDGA